MARTKILSDDDALVHALALIQRSGPESLTFASLAGATGLSGATLVQRFRNKAELRQRTLMHAWDGLDRRTAELVAAMERTPDGACRLLVALSADYGDANAYAQGLLLLREDMRDPVLRSRGLQWKQVLTDALDDCFAGAPANMGSLLAIHWQGALLWWAFDPRMPVQDCVDGALRTFIAALLRAA